MYIRPGDRPATDVPLVKLNVECCLILIMRRRRGNRPLQPSSLSHSAGTDSEPRSIRTHPPLLAASGVRTPTLAGPKHRPDPAVSAASSARLGKFAAMIPHLLLWSVVSRNEQLPPRLSQPSPTLANDTTSRMSSCVTPLKFLTK